MEPQNMKAQQRYFIAKYVADARRMEPRNIGIMLWTPKGTHCEFLEDHLVTFVKDKSLYRRWTEYWSDTLASEAITKKGWVSVTRDDPNFLEAIAESQRGNFLLVDGGFVTEPIRKNRLTDATRFLFEQLVSTPQIERRAAEIDSDKSTFQKICGRIFEKAGLNSIKAGRRIPCNVNAVHREFPVNYSLQNDGDLIAIYQRVFLSDEKSVDSASFMFEKFQASHAIANRMRCGAIYRMTSESEPISGALDQLALFSQPINADDENAASLAVTKVAAGLVLDEEG
jgi:hypothetical protein